MPALAGADATVVFHSEKGGIADSDDFGSGKTFGAFAPLSTAGTPISVSQIGLPWGAHAVASVHQRGALTTDPTSRGRGK